MDDSDDVIQAPSRPALNLNTSNAIGTDLFGAAQPTRGRRTSSRIENLRSRGAMKKNSSWQHRELYPTAQSAFKKAPQVVPLRASPDKGNGQKNVANAAGFINAPLQRDSMLYLQAVDKADKKGSVLGSNQQMKHADSVYPDGLMNYSLKPGELSQMVRAFSRGRKSNLPSEGGNTFNPTPQNISDRPSAAGWSS